MRSTVIFLLAVILIHFSYSEDNLYDLLAIPRTSSKSDIKKAYVKLAQKWHPDKNKSPEAADMMTKINKAYEVLSDDDRRRRYDLVGDDSEPSPRMPHPYMRPGGARFTFKMHETPEPTDEINTKMFMETIVPASDTIPYILYFFHDFCTRCEPYTERWEELKQDFKNLGVRTASVNVIISSRVASYCNVFIHEVPAISILMSGNVHHYNLPLDIDLIKGFLSSHFPSTIINEVSDSSAFLSTDTRIIKNKPVVLLVTPRTSPTLNYKMVAFNYQKSMEFYFLSTTLLKEDLLNELGLSLNKHLLIYTDFKEPVVKLKDAEITKESTKSALERNSVLTLPRISSSHIFDIVCPYGANTRTCVILIVNDEYQYNDEVTSTFRHLAVKWKNKQFKLAYLDNNKHWDFMSKFEKSHDTSSQSCDNEMIPRPILILRRLSSRRSEFIWYDTYCGAIDDEQQLERIALRRKFDDSAYLDILNNEDYKTTHWILDILIQYWEKIIAFIGLPLPLLVLSCFLFLRPTRRDAVPFVQMQPTGGRRQRVVLQVRRNVHVRNDVNNPQNRQQQRPTNVERNVQRNEAVAMDTRVGGRDEGVTMDTRVGGRDEGVAMDTRLGSRNQSREHHDVQEEIGEESDSNSTIDDNETSTVTMVTTREQQRGKETRLIREEHSNNPVRNRTVATDTTIGDEGKQEGHGDETTIDNSTTISHNESDVNISHVIGFESQDEDSN